MTNLGQEAVERVVIWGKYLGIFVRPLPNDHMQMSAQITTLFIHLPRVLFDNVG